MIDADTLEECELVDAETWMQAQIYRAKEKVRAIHRGDKWFVYDGVRVHEFTEEQFKDAYELAAQSQVARKVDAKTVVYEHH